MTDDTAPAPASIRRNAVLALGAEITTGLFTAVLTIYLIRALGPGQFGLFSVALSVGTLVMLPADFGLSQSAARFLAERRHSREAMAHVFANALRIKLVAAAIVAAALFALAGPIADAYSQPGLLWPMRAMAVAVFSQSTFGLFRMSFEAIGRLGTDWIAVAVESGAEVLATIALVALGAGAAGAGWGRAIGYGIGAAAGIALIVRLLGPRVLRSGGLDRTFARSLATYGSALLVVDGAYAAFAQIDVLLVGAIIGADAAGVFAAPMRFVTLIVYPASALTAGIAPRMASTGGARPEVGPLQRGLELLTVFGLLVSVPLLVWAQPLVDLVLGSGYDEAAGVLRALIPYILLVGPTRILTTSVNYLGEARRRIAIVVVALAVNVGLDIWLINSLGVIGAAIGNDVAFAIYAFGHLYVCRRLTDLRLTPLLRSFGRGLLAAAAMAAVLLAIGRGDDVSTPLLVLGLLVGPAVFVGALLALREPLVAELAAGVPGLERLRRR